MTVKTLPRRNAIMKALLGDDFQDPDREQVTARIPCNIFDLWVHWERVLPNRICVAATHKDIKIYFIPKGYEMLGQDTGKSESQVGM